jgi:hypothetical protein
MEPPAVCVHADGSEHLAPIDPDGFSYTCDWARLGWGAPPYPKVPTCHQMLPTLWSDPEPDEQ